MASFNINAVDRRIQYTSTGQTAFNFSFQVNASSELQVYINDVLKTETTHYSVSLNGDGTGTVTFGSATTAGEIITIIGDQPLSRTTVFQTGQANNPATLETEFDNVLIRQQQLKEITDRSIQLKVTTPRTVTGSGTSGPLEFPYDATTSNNADKLIAYDSNGTSLILGPTTAGVTTLSAIATDVQALAAITSNITTAAGIASNITTVAGLSSQITTLGSISGLDTLASNSANVTTAATNISSINTAATNITAIQNASTNATNAAASATAAAASAASAASSSGGGAVKITSSDTAPDVLNTKLLVAGGLTKAVGNAGGNETLTLTAQAAEVYGFETFFNPSTLVKTVTVVSVSGSNKYFIDGVQQDTLELFEGNTYVFNYPSGHPFKFSTTSNGTHASGSEYTTGVTHNSSTQVTIVVATDAPTLYYYCSSHSGMGGQANTPKPSDNSVKVTTTDGGDDNISSTDYANFDDVIYGASGMTWSLQTNGDLRVTI